jgi:CPA1 family monovalent cation:H+ antiporter
MPHLHPIELILALLLLVIAIALLSARLKVPYPILLVLGGLAISFIPGLPRVQLQPDLVFLVFLPPLLYYAGLLTTWRDFRANFRPIALLAVGLVLFTTVAIALVASALIPGLPLAAAFVLGAIVSPPDAVAATAITERLRVPRRITTILDGESLVNDATALVAYRFAVAAIVTGYFSLTAALGQFVIAATAGTLIGLCAAAMIVWMSQRIREPNVEGAISLLTPYLAYLPAEWAGASGVLAAVAAGIYVSRKLPTFASPNARLRAFAVWETLVFLLNGVIFILIGLQLPVVMERLAAIPRSQLALYALAICATAILTRILWVFGATAIRRMLSAKLRQRDDVLPWRHVMLIAWSGMRGIVSLAAALALPMTTASANPFPGRDLILFLTFTVILATLVFQGLTLPPLIRFLKLTADDLEHREERDARIQAAHAALSRLHVLSFDPAADPRVLDRLRLLYEERLQRLGDHTHHDHALEHRSPQEVAPTVHREALIAERRMITFLRDQNDISDTVLRRLLHEIDLEEARLST